MIVGTTLLFFTCKSPKVLLLLALLYALLVFLHVFNTDGAYWVSGVSLGGECHSPEVAVQATDRAAKGIWGICIVGCNDVCICTWLLVLLTLLLGLLGLLGLYL